MSTHPYEGTWIWDQARYEPPPNVQAHAQMVAETMSVAHDDGVAYASRIEQTYSNGARRVFVARFAENGAMHPVVAAAPDLLMGVSVQPDVARKLVSAYRGTVSESTCRIVERGALLRCDGIYHAADGSAGAYVCWYHRDSSVQPVV